MQVIGTLERLARDRVEERVREAEHAERLRLARAALHATESGGPERVEAPSGDGPVCCPPCCAARPSAVACAMLGGRLPRFAIGQG